MTSLEPIKGSNRRPFLGETGGRANPEEQLEISIYLRDDVEPIASRATLKANREERLRPAIDRLRQFAANNAIAVIYENPARRLIKLAGSVSALEKAFSTQLHYAVRNQKRYRVRSGLLHLPADLTASVESVLGLDNRPAASPKFVFPRVPQTAESYFPNEVAKAYAFPAPSQRTTSVCIAIIELGGGYNASDNDTAFKAMGLTTPSIVPVSVSGASNAPGDGSGADGEVALDIQVAGGAAPNSKLAVYFSPNTDQGFIDAISQASHDEANTPKVMSISWGSAESNWTEQAMTSMNSAFRDAVALGLTVCAASGDGLASDGLSDGALHVDFPASSPFVVGCGGTRTQISQGEIHSETVWNADGNGSGGGVSSVFGLPAYQSNANVPNRPQASVSGRGVPDVAANADPNTGYKVVVGGVSQIIGGTSAVAPLIAAMFALINSELGKSVGQPHTALYAAKNAFRDITQGNNEVNGDGYTAGTGWDACTGLGAPIGNSIGTLFR